MCFVNYTLEVCPGCPYQPRKDSPNKLYQNEREINVTLQKCDNAAEGKSCYPRTSEDRPVEEIWICEKDGKGQDLRIIKSCYKHGMFESSKRTWERNAKVLEKENRKASKHPKVVQRKKGVTGPLSFEIDASYEILRALGIERKADLEYDDPKELEAAERTDERYEEWKERMAGWSPY